MFPFDDVSSWVVTSTIWSRQVSSINSVILIKTWNIYRVLPWKTWLPKAPVTHSLQPVGDLLATEISGGRREVAGWLQGGRRPVAEGCRDDLVARRFWLLQVKPLCDQIDRRKVFGGRRQVADWSPTGWGLIADQLQRLQTRSTQFLVADWSPTSRRSVADRSPKSCRLSAIKNKRSRYSLQPVADRSPIDSRSLPNWSPTGRQLLSDYTTV